MEKVAFITGITGQDGSYLAELLLENLMNREHPETRSKQNYGKKT